jgi:putative copper export protein
MPPKLIGFVLITFLHNLFTVIWLGGMIVTSLAYMPAVKDALGAGPQMKKVMFAFQKKQSVWVYISMAGLILTGLLMGKRSPEFVQLFSLSNPYSIALTLKHVTVLIMMGIALYRVLVLGRQKGPSSPGKEKLNASLLLVNVVLAVLVLLNSAVVSALAMPLPGA